MEDKKIIDYFYEKLIQSSGIPTKYFGGPKYHKDILRKMRKHKIKSLFS